MKIKKNYTLLNSASQTTITSHYISDYLLSRVVSNCLDQKIIKAWIITEVSFNVIDNLFIWDIFKEFNSAYNPPSRTTLSNQLLNKELAWVNKVINNDLNKVNHLTLG